jgi:tetratricopeptide (TPR) repeat protein
MESGRSQEALQEFESMKKLDPGNKDVYYLIGRTYQQMNQLERALEAYRQCTSGVYASVSQSAVKLLEKKIGKVNAK